MRGLFAKAEALIFELRGGVAAMEPHLERVGPASLFVPPSVLSPKTFKTGILLARAVRKIACPEDPVLDMGSGSGVVGVFAALSGAKVVAVDKNPAAVRATRVSAMLSNVEIDAREGDLFGPLSRGETFRIIAFNPPFFTRRAGGELELALFGGESLEVLDRFLEGARAHRSPSGRILIAGSTLGALERMRSLYVHHGFRWRTVLQKERISERLVIDELA